MVSMAKSMKYLKNMTNSTQCLKQNRKKRKHFLTHFMRPTLLLYQHEIIITKNLHTNIPYEYIDAKSKKLQEKL